MARIFVGAKEAILGVPTGRAHSYLVFEDDAGERFVTSLTEVKDRSFQHPFGKFDVTQIHTPYADASESSARVRVEEPLGLAGREAEAVWDLVTQHAREIREEEPAYNPLTQNSNSFVASLLNVVGIDYEDELPHFDGDKVITGNPSPSDYPGIGNLLDFDYALHGTPGRDIIRGAGGADRLAGREGADFLDGRNGSDVLNGDLGNDRLEGGSGGDALLGGRGRDLLWGDGGADRFVFTTVLESSVAASRRDHVEDFARAEGDRLDLRAIDARPEIVGDQAFAWRGAAAFSGPGQLRYTTLGLDTVVTASLDADRAPESSLQLDDHAGLRVSDFLL
jgi:hypothetical protein